MHSITITKNQQSKVRSPHGVQSLNSCPPDNQAPQVRAARCTRWRKPAGRLPQNSRTPSHRSARSGPFRAQLKARAALLALHAAEASRPLSCDDSRQPLLPPAASPALCTCTCAPVARSLKHITAGRCSQRSTMAPHDNVHTSTGHHGCTLSTGTGIYTGRYTYRHGC